MCNNQKSCLRILSMTVSFGYEFSFAGFFFPNTVVCTGCLQTRRLQTRLFANTVAFLFSAGTVPCGECFGVKGRGLLRLSGGAQICTAVTRQLTGRSARLQKLDFTSTIPLSASLQSWPQPATRLTPRLPAVPVDRVSNTVTSCSSGLISSTRPTS